MTNARTARNARERAAILRAEAARREARNRSIVVTGVVAVVLAAVVGVFVMIQTLQHDTATSGTGTPATGATGAVTVGQAGAPVTIVAYEDFQCPACKDYEDANDPQLDQWLAAGKVKIEYHPIAFLDRASTDDYSTRALNAAATVLDLAPAGFQKFHDALYAEQPAEGGPGLSNERLLQLAVAAGAPEAQAKADIDGVTFKAWTARVTEDASKAGVSQTPTLIVNGKPLADHSPQAVAAAVTAATEP